MKTRGRRDAAAVNAWGNTVGVPDDHEDTFYLGFEHGAEAEAGFWRPLLARARAAGRRLGEYWRIQCYGEESHHELLVALWRAEGRLQASAFPVEPTGGYHRGSGPCRNCGLRAWIGVGTHPNTRYKCVGCGKDHEETGRPIRPRRTH